MASPQCASLLQSLGHEDSTPRRLLTLQWDEGFSIGDGRMSDDLFGRITLTILTLDASHAGPGHRRAIREAFRDFRPQGCSDMFGPPGCAWSSQAFTWVDANIDATAADGEGEPPSSPAAPAVCYSFFRWNGPRASTEREERAVREPGACEAWEAVVAKVTPPVVSWMQERWDIEMAPCYVRHTEET